MILVTGSAKRKKLGSEIIKKLVLDKKQNVLIHYNESKQDAIDLKSYLLDNVELNSNNNPIHIDIIQGDFSDEKSIISFCDEIFKRGYKLSGIINNVGCFLPGSVLDAKIDDIYKTFETNIFAPMIIIKRLQKVLNNGAFIINMGIAGLESKISVKSAIYFMTKQNLLFLTKSLAKELVSKNISVNMISPGYLENSNILPNPKSFSKIIENRTADFNDITSTVIHLMENRYITGQNIEIAGGVNL
jgi:NAD(P)-dependent dehydrogenase (short-subunit alcohol dehydrogenase family)